MLYNYFDIHSHLNLSQFRDDWQGVIKKLEEEKIGTITIGTNKQSSKKAVEIAQTSDYVFAGVGIHPTDNRYEKFGSEFYLSLASQPEVVTIGECGLDYFRNDQGEEEKERQKELFKKHIELSLVVDKSLMIHCRPSEGTMDAYLEAHEIIKDYQQLILAGELKTLGKKVRGNMHFFAGDIEVAKKFLEFDFTFSFAGPITFARDYDEVIRFLPIENIIGETDSPFAAPVPYRGKRNEPLYVVEVYKKIAEIRGVEEDELRKKILNNINRQFGISID